MKVDNSVIEKFHDFKLKKNTGYLVLGFSDDISKIVVINEAANKVPQNAAPAEKSKIETLRYAISITALVFRQEMGGHARSFARE